MNVAVARHPRGIGVLGELAEPSGKGFVLGVGELLVAQEDHLVPEQCRTDFGEGLFGHPADFDPGDFRTHGGGQRAHLDVAGGARVVIELTGRVESHLG